MASNLDGHVHVLPLHVANKIAAGEVVERPASVVKELVENSIDAGSRHIRIAIVQGGRKLVSIQDDGCGMTKDDALLSLERQATSKILDVHDIENIATLGFRGEAIPSIASVSRFSITTRRHEFDEGVFIQVNAGTVAEVRSAGCPAGTRVEVRDLFCNVPARRKFLRAYATEEGHIRQIFVSQALAHPEIGFSMTLDGRELYNLPPAAAAKDRIADIFPQELSESLLPVDSQSGEISIKGFIERPNLSNPTRREQYVFINGRSASAPSVAYALKEAYPHRQGEAKPALFLFIDLPPREVDVNVHPAKREVRFRNNSAVKNALIAAIGKTLGLGATDGGRPATAMPAAKSSFADMPPSTLAKAAVDKSEERSKPPPATAANDMPAANPVEPQPVPVQLALPETAPKKSSLPWKTFHVLGCTDSGYVLIETEDGVVTINPAAANERIAFERLQKASIPSQRLLLPETVKLSPAESVRIKNSMKELERIGFAIEEFGIDTFKIDAVPQLGDNLPLADILSTLAQDLAASSARKVGENWKEDLIARSLAKSMRKRPCKLDARQSEMLVEDLSACRMPYVTPAGKPIMIFTSNNELFRKFHGR